MASPQQSRQVHGRNGPFTLPPSCPTGHEARSLIGQLRSWAGRIRRATRRQIDLGLHDVRRRRALERVSSLSDPGGVLFLCLGNVCRSPYAEARWRAYTNAGEDDWPTRSGGFIGPDRPPPDSALAAARARGLDLAAHRSKIVTRESLGGVVLVVVMATSQVRRLRRAVPGFSGQVLVLGDLDPEPTGSRTIPDPWGKDRADFDTAYERIDRCLEQLALSLLRKPSTS